jgi:hypothetical protein
MELANFQANIIAISSILMTLDQMKLPNYKSEFFSFLNSYFPLIDYVRKTFF